MTTSRRVNYSMIAELIADMTVFQHLTVEYG